MISGSYLIYTLIIKNLILIDLFIKNRVYEHFVKYSFCFFPFISLIDDVFNLYAVISLGKFWEQKLCPISHPFLFWTPACTFKRAKSKFYPGMRIRIRWFLARRIKIKYKYIFFFISISGRIRIRNFFSAEPDPWKKIPVPHPWFYQCLFKTFH